MQDIPPIDDVPIRKEVTTVRSDSVLSNISDPGGGKSNTPPNPERSFSASSALQMQKENKRMHKRGISREGSVGKDGQAGSSTCKPSRSIEKMGSFGKADNVVSCLYINI